MDIRYRLESEVVKEEIILKKKEAATAEFTFVMKHPGLAIKSLQMACGFIVRKGIKGRADRETSDEDAVFTFWMHQFYSIKMEKS